MNERLEEYDGTTAVVRTEHLPAEEIEFMRWKAERWMKVHHIPAASGTIRSSSCSADGKCWPHFPGKFHPLCIRP